MSDIVERLRKTVVFIADATGKENGRWVNEAADEIEGLRLEHQHACQEISVAVEERDFLRAALVAVAAARMPGESRRIAVEALRVVVGGSLK